MNLQSGVVDVAATDGVRLDESLRNDPTVDMADLLVHIDKRLRSEDGAVGLVIWFCVVRRVPLPTGMQRLHGGVGLARSVVGDRHRAAIEAIDAHVRIRRRVSLSCVSQRICVVNPLLLVVREA